MTEAKNKTTKREMFTAIAAFLTVASPNMDATPEGVDPSDFLEDAIAFCGREIDLLDRKRGKAGAPTKAQKLNAVVKESIITALVDAGEPMKATAIGSAVGVSVQKASALLRQMVEAGEVARLEDKKEVFFQVL